MHSPEHLRSTTAKPATSSLIPNLNIPTIGIDIPPPSTIRTTNPRNPIRRISNLIPSTNNSYAVVVAHIRNRASSDGVEIQIPSNGARVALAFQGFHRIVGVLAIQIVASAVHAVRLAGKEAGAHGEGSSEEGVRHGFGVVDWIANKGMDLAAFCIVADLVDSTGLVFWNSEAGGGYGGNEDGEICEVMHDSEVLK